jgi:hypothetical protein
MKSIGLMRRRSFYGVLFVLTALYYSVPWRSMPGAGGVVGLPFLLLYCVGVPGFALQRRFDRNRGDAVAAVAVSAFYGLAVLLAGAFVWALSGVSIGVFARLLPVLVVAVGLTIPAATRDRPHPTGPVPSASSRWWTVGFTAFVLVVGALVLWRGPPIDYGKDTLDYVAYTNEVARTGEPFPTSEFYVDAGPYGTDVRKGLLHALYGYFKWYLGVETLPLFRGLGAVLLMSVILAVYTAARAFFPDRAVAVLAAVFFVIGFDGGLNSALIRSFFYPNRFAVGYLLFFLAAALAYMDRPRPRGLIACAVFAFAAVAVHIQYTVLLGFAVATIVVWKTCFDTGSYREHLLRSGAAGIAAFMGMLPYAVFRYLTAYQAGGASELHRQIQGAVFITDRLFFADPVHAWRSVGLMGVAAALAIIPLWPRRRQYPALGYLIASFLSVILIQFNPLLLPLFYRFITYLVYRLGIVSPYYILVAFFVVTAVRPQRVGAAAWGRYRRAVLVVALLAIAAGLAPIWTGNVFSPSAIAWERENSYLGWQAGLLQLRKLPERSVIASDPVTSYTIAAFTSHYVVCTFDQHAPPGDLLVRERTIAARDILSPFTSASDKAHQIADHRVSHVVVNENVGLLRLTDYWTVSKHSAPAVEGRMRELPSLFEEENPAGDLRVYRTTGAAPRHVAVVENPLLRRRAPASAKRVHRKAGLARLEAARITALDSVPHAGSFEVTLYWRRERELPLDKYFVSVRLNRLDLRLPLGGRPFPKVSRKLKEWLAGVRYRFREDHQIVDGFYPPDTWPPGVLVVDRTTVQVPDDVAAGRYEVRAKMMTRTTSPNHRLRDFLYDDDVYHGVSIGEITIGRTE